MNLRDKKVEAGETIDIFPDGTIGDDYYLSQDVDHHISNFVNKIIDSKNITKGKVFKLLKEEFGEKK